MWIREWPFNNGRGARKFGQTLKINYTPPPFACTSFEENWMVVAMMNRVDEDHHDAYPVRIIYS